ncbi:hypothetical protein MTR_3g087320 [Medicago truncatula]|uniref:Uncharacterized protein n=1 Tax=Medicago truncatula TaxID=3880 RepID=G7J3S9_MEDTR|nr:hypothetical protein MTR_3g087320 [Medicago truncatula]
MDICISLCAQGFIVVYRYASTTPLPHFVHSQGIGWQYKYDWKFSLLDLTCVGKCGVVFASIPPAIVDVIYIFNDIINVPFQSKSFVKDSSIKNDKDKHSWDNYMSFKGNIISEKFYSVPFNLNK